MKKRTALIIVVAAVLVVGLLGFLSSGFTNGDVNTWVKERNPENLMDYQMPVDEHNMGDGTYVEIKEDGTIKITGEIEEDSDTWTYELGDVILPAGTYTLTCDKRCNKSNYIIHGTYKDESGANADVYSDISGNTITLTKDTTVNFSVEIFKEGNINLELRPILNLGTKPVDFYVKKTIGG